MFFYFGADKAQAARSASVHSDNVMCLSTMASSLRIFNILSGDKIFYYNGNG